MDKKFESDLSPQQQNYIKEKLFEKYQDSFERNGIKISSNLEICNLAEFLITEHPEKYARTAGDEHNYRSNENLQKIYAVIDKEKDFAVLINTNDKGKVPEGEFGTYDLDKHKFKASKQIKETYRKAVKELANDTLTEKEINEMVDKILPHDLDGMDKLATIGERNIHEKARKAVDQKIDEKNEENGISKTEREQYENKKENKEKLTVGDGNSKEDGNIPKDVQEGMQKAGTTQIVRYFYVNAKELGEKVEDAKVNKTGGKVLVMEISDSSRVSGPNRYYAFQDNRMVLWGNDDKDVKDVVGNNQKMGQVLQPLRMQQPEYIEYRDSNGLYIKEEIDDKMDLSVEEINRYKLSMEDTLEQYSSRINVVLASNMPPEQKIKRIQEIDDWCDRETTVFAAQNDISSNDDRNIDKLTDETTEKVQEQIENDGLDERGKPLHY